MQQIKHDVKSVSVGLRSWPVFMDSSLCVMTSLSKYTIMRHRWDVAWHGIKVYVMIWRHVMLVWDCDHWSWIRGRGVWFRCRNALNLCIECWLPDLAEMHAIPIYFRIVTLPNFIVPKKTVYRDLFLSARHDCYLCIMISLIQLHRVGFVFVCG